MSLLKTVGGAMIKPASEAGSFALDVALWTSGHMMEGEKLPAALAKGAAESMFWQTLGPAGMAIVGGQMAFMGGSLVNQIRKRRYADMSDYFYNPGAVGGGFKETQQTLTMRQAAVQALQQTRINGRMMLGNEASFMHK